MSSGGKDNIIRPSTGMYTGRVVPSRLRGKRMFIKIRIDCDVLPNVGGYARTCTLVLYIQIW